MQIFVEICHGYAVDMNEVVYYQVLPGESYDCSVEYNPDYERNNFPVKLKIGFKNGTTLEIPEMERYWLNPFLEVLHGKSK